MTPTSPPVQDDIVQLASTTDRSERPAGETQQENSQPDASLGVEQSKMEEFVPGLLNELPCLKAEYDRFDLFRKQEISRLAAVDARQAVEGQRLEAENSRLLGAQVRWIAEAEKFSHHQTEVIENVAIIVASQRQERERLRTKQKDLKTRTRHIKALGSQRQEEIARERAILIRELQEFDQFRKEETMQLQAMRDHQEIENELLEECREYLEAEQRRLKGEKGYLKDEAKRIEGSRRRVVDMSEELDVVCLGLQAKLQDLSHPRLRRSTQKKV